MVTVLWCYLRNPAFKIDGVDYHVSADLTGQANHLGVTIEADIIKQKLPENNGGYNALDNYGKTSKPSTASSPPTTRSTSPATRWPTATWAAIGLINSGGASSGASDLAEAVRTAVINKRAGGMGLISGRKAFQRPMAEGVELLNAIQDVYLDTASTSPDRPTSLRGDRRGVSGRRFGGDTLNDAPDVRVRPKESLAPRGQQRDKGVHVADTAERTTTQELDRVIIRFAGDSGDGMQLTGDRFTSASALFGNDLATLPEFPAEIRAPAGTLAGVSAFQVHISDHEITTPGDAPNVLVAMNPAALHAELEQARAGRHGDRQRRHLRRAQPHQGRLRRQPADRRHPQGLQRLRGPDDLADQGGVSRRSGVKPRDADRSKNFFALGLISWMYTRPEQPTLDWISEKFAKRPLVARRQPGRVPGRPRLR